MAGGDWIVVVVLAGWLLTAGTFVLRG